MVDILQFVIGLVNNTNHIPAIQYRHVPVISQVSASVGVVFQALGWVFTIKD